MTIGNHSAGCGRFRLFLPIQKSKSPRGITERSGDEKKGSAGQARQRGESMEQGLQFDACDVHPLKNLRAHPIALDETVPCMILRDKSRLDPLHKRPR